MKSKVKIPWFINEKEQLLVSWLNTIPNESDEGSSWRCLEYGGAWPSGKNDVPTHLLTWKESEDIKGSLVVTGIHRGRSSATMKIELTRDDGKLIKGTMNVNYQPMLAAGMVNGRAGATIRARKRGNNYLFELISVDAIYVGDSAESNPLESLRQELEQLRAENAELRRQLREHAATVMYKAEYGKDGS